MERIDGSSLGFSELMPRYVLIEDAIRGQRVLEVGTTDPASLLRLSAAGATRIAATHEKPDRFDRVALKGRRIELLPMASGQLDFDDHSFDVILVPDLITSLAGNPSFLSDLRRVMSPGGFALLGFEAAGRRLAELFGGREASAVRGDPRRMIDGIKRAFGNVKLYRQTPFVGVAFLAESSSADAGLSLDTSLSGTESEPSHVMVIVGRIDALPDERTLVELPMAALESMALQAERERIGERTRLEQALQVARAEIEKREVSLRAIGEKLPALKAAVEAQAQRTDEREVAALRQTIAEHEERVRSLGSEVAAERARRNDTLSDGDQQRVASALKEQALIEELERAKSWIIALEREKSDLSSRAEEASLIAEASVREVEEIRRRAREMERADEIERRRIEALEAELEKHTRARHHLGSDVREAEARAAMLSRRLEEHALERAQEVHQLLGRAAALAESLAETARAREDAESRADRFEAALAEAERKNNELERRIESVSRRVIEEQQPHDHDVRREAFSARTEAESLRRQVSDRESAVHAMREEMRAAALAAAAQIEALRARIQELRNERDTLARASQLLLEERDLAAALGRQVIDADQRTKALVIQLASRDDALARLEVERDAAEHARGAFEGALRDLAEANKRAEGEAALAIARAAAAEKELQSHRGRVQLLDQQLARLHAELQGRAVMAADADRRLPEMEELLREAAQSLREAQRENQAWRDRAQGFDRARLEAETQANDVLQARARTEAQLAELLGEKVALTGDVGRAKADLAMSGARLTAAENAWRRVMGERDTIAAQLKETQAAAEAMLLAHEQTRRPAPAADPRLLDEARAAVAKAEANAAREKREREQAALGLGKTLEQAAEMSKKLSLIEREIVGLRKERDAAVFAASEVEALRRERDAARAELEEQRTAPAAPVRAWVLDHDRVPALEAALEEARARAVVWAAERAELIDQLALAGASRGQMAALESRMLAAEEAEIRAGIERVAPMEEAEIRWLDRPTDVAERIALAEELEHERWRRREIEHSLAEAQREREQVVARTAPALEAARARIVAAEQENGNLKRERETLRTEVERRLGDLRNALAAKQAEMTKQAEEADRRLAEERAYAIAADAARNQAELAAERAVAEANEIERARLADRDAHTQAEAQAVHLEEALGRALEAEARLTWAEGVQAELQMRLHGAEERANEAARIADEALTRQTSDEDALDEDAEARWTDARASLEARLVEAEASWHEADSRAIELDSHVARLHDELASARSDAEHARQDAQAEHQLAAELMERLSSLDPSTDLSGEGAGTALESARLQVEVLENDLEALEAERQADAEHVVAVERSEAETRAAVEKLVADLAEASAAREAAEAERLSADAESTFLRNLLEAELETKRKLEAAVEDAESRATEQLLRAQAAKEALDAADARRVAAERSTSSSGSDAGLLKAKLADADGRAAKAEAQIARLDSALHKIEQRSTESEARAARAEDQAMRSERSSSKNEARAVEAEKRATEAESRAHQATVRLTAIEPKVKVLEQRLAEAETRTIEASRTAQKAESEVQRLEQRAVQMAEELGRARIDAPAPAASRPSEPVPRQQSTTTASIQLQAAREEIEILRDNLRAALARPPEGDARPAGPGLTASLRARCDSLEAAVGYRDAEIQRLRAQQERAQTELDEARAEIGRKLNEIRFAQQASEEMRREITDLRRAADDLRGAVSRQGDAVELAREVQARQQEIEKLQAQRGAVEGELRRLKGQLSGAESNGAQLGMRVAELEAAVADGQERVDLLRRELADKSERLRRMREP